MGLFDNIKGQIEGVSTPKQFQAKLEVVGVYIIPAETIAEVNKNYQQEVARLDAEDLEALKEMDKIWSD